MCVVASSVGNNKVSPYLTGLGVPSGAPSGVGPHQTRLCASRLTVGGSHRDLVSHATLREYITGS